MFRRRSSIILQLRICGKVWEDEEQGIVERPPGSDLFSHTVTSAVSSALKRFTSVFGMGTGGSTSLVPPGDRTME